MNFWIHSARTNTHEYLDNNYYYALCVPHSLICAKRWPNCRVDVVGWHSKLSLIIFIDVAAAITVVPANEIRKRRFEHQYCRLLSAEEKIFQRNSFRVLSGECIANGTSSCGRSFDIRMDRDMRGTENMNKYNNFFWIIFIFFLLFVCFYRRWRRRYRQMGPNAYVQHILLRHFSVGRHQKHKSNSKLFLIHYYRLNWFFFLHHMCGAMYRLRSMNSDHRPISSVLTHYWDYVIICFEYKFKLIAIIESSVNYYYEISCALWPLIAGAIR